MEKELEIFESLRKLGCCKLCAVRFLCKKTIDLGDTDGYLEEVFYSDRRKRCFRILFRILQNGFPKSDNGNDGIKKIKTNPCIVCLGLLQQETITSILATDKLKRAKQYDSNVFTCSISMPASILLREQSLKIYLKGLFPDFYDDNTEVPLNRAWKMFVRNELARYLGKEFENSDTCDFSINIHMDYIKDTEELDCLKKMQPKMYEVRSVQRRKYNGELFSRKGVLTALSETDFLLFEENYPVPPQVPSDFLTVKDIECKHDSIFFAGRYLKFSRELSQSPWIIDGIKAMETSVQEIIFDEIKNSFGILESNLKFSSSGREDCDVRCLGKGRPFYIEIMDPMKAIFTFDEFRQLEREINKSKLIKVLHLQRVDRNELVKIKEGEESKTKDYNALCLCKDPVTQEQIDKINNHGKIEILQKTPIRVLHRRPLAVRTRTIHEMRAKLVEGKPFLIDLHLNTQAGTYVKEFIHGDFGRTTPSIGKIIGSEVDIIALDVTAINLDWPEEINYNLIENVT